MTSFTLGSRVDQRPPRTRTEAEQLQPVGNLMIDLAELTEAYGRAMERWTRITSRLDGHEIEATEEQRMQAESKAAAYLAEAKRHERERDRKLKVFRQEWADLDTELRDWIQAEALPMPCWAGIRALIGVGT